MTVESQRRNAFIWSFFGAISLLMIVSPFVFKVDMDSGGGALLFVGFIGIISSAVAAGIFFNRASTLTKMLLKENVLAEWNMEATDGSKTIISRDGLLTEDCLYTFKDMACKLRKVEITPTPSSPSKVKFTIEVPSKYSTKNITLEVRIPKGQVDTAKETVAALSKQYFSKE